MIYTSYYGGLRYLLSQPSLAPVCISAGKPPWFKGRSEPRLAPDRSMFALSLADFIIAYQAKLAHLDPATILRDLGDGATMLCWEVPGNACHRRIVAEWLEQHLDIQISEFGWPRSVYPDFAFLTPKGKTPCALPARTNIL